MKLQVIKYVFASIAIILSVLITVSIIPTLSLELEGMDQYQGHYVNVFFEDESSAAFDVFEEAESKALALSEKLEIELSSPINVYVYDEQKMFQTKKYGLFIPYINLEWYVGDNVKDEVILTSPSSQTLIYDYDAMVEIALHELVHAMNYRMNPKMSLWINEGVALYLTNGNPPQYLLDYYQGIPTIKQMHTVNPIAFANMGGYDFSYTYIEFIDQTYGWDFVLKLMASSDYQHIFHKSEEVIYHEWLVFLENHYMG